MSKNMLQSHKIAIALITVLIATIGITKIGKTNMGPYSNEYITNQSFNRLLSSQAPTIPGATVQGSSVGGATVQGSDPNSHASLTPQTTITLPATDTRDAGFYIREQQAAQAAAKAQADASARNQFNQGRTNILDSIRNAGQNFVQTGRANILDFVEGMRTQQQGLDTQRANAALGKRNATSGIQNMVGQGIRSSGVQLANRNAGDSSAALGLAQAYGRMGNQRMQDVNQQFGIENANLDMAQQNLDTTRESGLRRFDLEKEQTINNLTMDAQQQFATLNQMAEGAGIMDRIAIEQEKENIKNQLIQQLAELDARGSASAVRPMDQMGVQNRAQELMSAGGNAGTQFDFTGVAPATMQTGAAISQLPIFSNRRRRD